MAQPLLRGRLIVAFALLLAMFVSSLAPASAVTTGSITGQVTDTSGNALAGVAVVVSAPTDRRAATTDSRGFFAVTGLNSDTYTLSFSLSGYELATVAGVTVFPDQQQQVNAQLTRTLQRIGRTSARSTVGAFQPTQTLDTYSVNPKKIEQLLGKSGATSESALVYTLPGAQSVGNPSLRGGRTNQIGWSWEGLTDIDPSTNQFANSLLLNGVQTLQLTPGAGPASNATAGTGTVNLTVKRGTRPPFGSFQAEADLNRFRHRLVGEYGFATPDNRFSSYLSFIGTNTGSIAGPRGTPQALIGNYYGTESFTQRDIVSNNVYRFGKDQSKSIQLVMEDILQRSTNDIGGYTNLFYNAYDPNNLINLRGYTPASSGSLSAIQLQRLEPQLPNQIQGQPNIGYPDTQIQPESKIKLEYDNQLDARTTLAARLYRINAVTTFDLRSYPQGAIYQLQGGYRYGSQLDLTRQFNDKNLVTAGLAYSYERPLIDGLSNDIPYQVYSGALRGNAGLEIFDFTKLQAGETCGLRNASQCGYIYGFPQFAGQSQIALPIYDRVVNFDRGIYSVYIDDAISLSRRLKLDLGVRDDIASIKYNRSVDRQFSNPSVIQPRASFSYQITNADAIRASYGRTVNFPQLSNLQSQVNPAVFASFAGIPSFNVAACTPAQVVGTGAGQCNPAANPAKNCGVDQKTLCKDYADQLYWEMQAGARGTALVQPLKPETFSNWDASYSHQFKNNVGMKITPFFRRGFDVTATAQTPLLDANGNAQYTATGNLLLNPAVATNLGIERATGVEFLLTKDADVGFSGQLTMTYVNEITNSLPLSTQENVFPRIPLQSILLGHTYRAGYLSPFVATGVAQYQTRDGWRFNTLLSYNKGYPIGNGTLGSIFLNGKPVDVPLTDLTLGASGRTAPAQFVDPSNPGSFTRPNIAAQLGTPEAPSPGGMLNNPRLSGTVTLEYSKPKSLNTIGIQVANVFNNLYARAARNARVQPVATGVFGPATGNLTRTSASAAATSPDLVNYPGIAFGTQPYTIFPNQTPLTTTVYYNVKL